MHQVTIERRTQDDLRGTLLTIEDWLARNGFEREQLQVRGTERRTVIFEVCFTCPDQARRFAEAFRRS